MYLLYCYLTALEEQEVWHHIFRILLYVHKEDNFIIVVIICSSCTAFASGNHMAVSFLLQIMWFKCVLCCGNYFFFFVFIQFLGVHPSYVFVMAVLIMYGTDLFL